VHRFTPFPNTSNCSTSPNDNYGFLGEHAPFVQSMDIVREDAKQGEPDQPIKTYKKGSAATPGMRNIPLGIVYVHCLLKADS
jgi:hypothetical protein